MRKIQLIIDVHPSYEGKASKRQYVWSRAGDVQFVNDEDVPDLLLKRIGKRLCCGDNILEGNKVFQEVE